MIKVKREDLLNSGTALKALGALNLPRAFGELKPKTWIPTVFSQLISAFNAENRIAAEYRNDKVMEIGQRYLDEQGLEQFQMPPSKMREFNQAIESFLNEEVEIDIAKIHSSVFFDDAVTLTLEDCALLQWLIDFDE